MTTDPSDIVERLKTLIALHPFAAVVHTNGDGSQIIISEYGESAVTDAIAEITRLRAALAAERERCARVADKYREMSCESADKALEKGDIDEHQEHAGDASIAKYIAAAIRAMGS